MENLFKDNLSTGKMTATSFKVAEIFEKDHDKVCRDIKNLQVSREFNIANFGVISYFDSMNRERTAFEMTKDGFSILVMGYSGEKAAQFKELFIDEFNKRGEMLLIDDYIIKRNQQIMQQKHKALEATIQQLVSKIEEMRPKELFADAVSTSNRSLLIHKLAKIINQNGYNIGGNRLFKIFKGHGYLCRRGDSYNQPTQKAIELGLFEIKKTVINTFLSNLSI